VASVSQLSHQPLASTAFALGDELPNMETVFWTQQNNQVQIMVKVGNCL